MHHNINYFTGAVLLFVALLFSTDELAAQSNQLRQSLEQHVYTLASDSLKGRLAGSEENKQAADYIIAQFEKMGLETDVQTFQGGIRSTSAPVTLENIIVTIEGSDPLLKDEWIVIGAHYDHIGIQLNMRDPSADVIYNGADDNASGVATIIELARIFKEMEGDLKRSIMFIAFDGEEQGLLGSAHFVANPTIPLEKIVAMFSLDMVGYLKTSGWLKYEGIGTIDRFKKLVADNVSSDFTVRYKKFETSLMGATDTQPFANAKVPTLYVSTGLKSPYHKPQDEAEGIDYGGLVSVTGHVSEIVDVLANNPAVKPSGRISPIHIISYPIIDYGITAGLGTSHFTYKGGNVKGKSTLSYEAGLFLSADLKYFSIRPEVLYEKGGSKHLGYWNSANPNIYDPMEGKVDYEAITVPLSIKRMLVQASSGSITVAGIYISAGAYYRHFLSISMFGDKVTENDPRFNWDQWGVTWGLGFQVFDFTIGYEAKYGLTEFMPALNANRPIRNVSSQIKLSYKF